MSVGPFVAGNVRSEGAEYALSFMNITTDKNEVGFIQIFIVAANETIARVQAGVGLLSISECICRNDCCVVIT